MSGDPVACNSSGAQMILDAAMAELLGHWHRKAGSNLIVKRLWRVVGGLLESNLVFSFLFSFHAGSPTRVGLL